LRNGHLRTSADICGGRMFRCSRFHGQMDIIALWLDDAIRRESRGEHSLDDVMFDLVRAGDQPIKDKLIRDAATLGWDLDLKGTAAGELFRHFEPTPSRLPAALRLDAR
jgi:hypothetical protein